MLRVEVGMGGDDAIIGALFIPLPILPGGVFAVYLISLAWIFDASNFDSIL